MAELGALSLRIQEQGGDAVLQKLRAIDGAAKLTGVSVDQAAKALNRLGIQAKVAGGQIVVAEHEVTRASGIVRKLGSDAQVTAGQVDTVTASVGRLGLRADTTGTAVTRMSPKLRSGASAMAALSVAAVTGGGSLQGMATQAGLVASVMASEFAPAKWAGYAAGIGAAVIAVTALVGIMRKLNEEARKPREAITNRIAAINITSLAEQEAARLRKERDALNKFIQDARESGFESTAGVGEAKRFAAAPQFEGVGPSPKTIREAQNRFKQLEAEFTEANKRLAELTSAQAKELQTAAIEGIVTAAEATKTVRLSELAKEQAAVEASFQSGTADLKAQFAERQRVIVESSKAERQALEARRASLLKLLPGEDPKGAEAQKRRTEAGAVSAEIKALANETAARLTALDQQRAAEERALAAKVLGYQVQLEQFSDTSFQRRIQQIQAEDAERRRVLQQRGNATQQELADLDALTEKQKTQLFLAKAQADLARLRESLAVSLQEVENRRLAGLIDEEEASRQIADVQRSALPTLQEAVDRAIALATELGDQGVLGALKAIKAELAQPILLNIDINSDAITKRLNAALAQIQAAVNTGVISEKQGRQMVAEQQFAAGFASSIGDAIAQGSVAALQQKNPLQALAQSMNQALGSLLIETGTQWIKGLAFMKAIQTWALANPVAAIAAAAAMVAFGAALGGRGGGGGSVGGFSGGSTNPTPISISRMVVDPNAGVRQRIAGAGLQTAAGSAGPTQTIEVIGINTPRGQALIGTASARYTGRGG